MTKQISTVVFFRFQGGAAKYWALKMMQLAHQELKTVRGQQFYRLMGSGKGKGFNPFPDWSVYCLLQVWDSEEEAKAFFETAVLFKAYQEKSLEYHVLYMKNIAAHGTWLGHNPFEKHALDELDGPIAVITRARIKWQQLISFWRYVPQSQAPLSNQKGLIYTKGIGELPIVQMATFSIWKNIEALKDFAYRSKEHQKAIRLTREKDWYSEELFSRFVVYQSAGSWNGKNWLDPN